MPANKLKMNTAVTGVNGFVGKNLIPYLEKIGFDIFCISRANLIAQSYDFIKTDAVVHLAGKAHDLKKTSSSDEYYQVNFELTKKLYDAFLKSEAKKFIFISSVKAAADAVDGILIEDKFPNPITDYGKSKLMAEQYIQNQPLPSDKSYYILRPCMVHGPGNKGNLNLLYKFVKKGVPYPLAAFKNRRSFLSVENLCFVIAQLLGKEIPSGVYQVADDEPLSTKDVVEILAASLDKNPKLWAIPTKLIRSAAKLGDILKLPLNTERLNKLTENYEVSNDKIKKALKTQLPITSYDGLISTAKSFADM